MQAGVQTLVEAVMRMRPAHLTPILLLVVAAVLAAPPAAQAAPGSGSDARVGHAGGSSNTPGAGYDISAPQCNAKFPSGAQFGIVGVNNGIVFSANPCLGTGDGPSELAWAQRAGNGAPAFYANTADPGPAYSSHWPTGQNTPQPCSADDRNSTACSYDYGYNAATDSFTNAVTAEEHVNGYSDATAQAAAAQASWWLDVETGNSWQTLEAAYGNTVSFQQNDVAALRGAVAALSADGVTHIGFYSTDDQWGLITGGDGTDFAAAANWVAGFRGAADASAGCTSANSFTGGPVTLTQYRSKGFDADHACA